MEDRGRFWKEEAKWDGRRYRYQKQLYDNARYRAERMGMGTGMGTGTGTGTGGGSNAGAGSGSVSGGSGSSGGAVVFSFYYYNDFGRLSVQLEKRGDRRCPFCWYDGGHDVGLVMHCKTVHGYDDGYDGDGDRDTADGDNDGDGEAFDYGCGGDDEKSVPRIVFEAGLDVKNNLHIMVKSLISRPRHVNVNPNPLPTPITRTGTGTRRGNTTCTSPNGTGSGTGTHNFVFTRSPNTTTTTNININPSASPISIPLVQLPTSTTCLLDPKTRKRKIRQLDQQPHPNPQTHKFATSQYIADSYTPIRQYYHSKTMQPMAPGEWDVDSDEEADDSWAKTLSECILKELGDVSPKEKVFLNLWNRFMESHTVIRDGAVPNKCEEFLEGWWEELIGGDLRNQFLLHLMNLWDNRLIPSHRIAALMKRYDEYECECDEKMKSGGGDGDGDNDGDACEKDGTNDSEPTPERPMDATGVIRGVETTQVEPSATNANNGGAHVPLETSKGTVTGDVIRVLVVDQDPFTKNSDQETKDMTSEQRPKDNKTSCDIAVQDHVTESSGTEIESEASIEVDEITTLVHDEAAVPVRVEQPKGKDSTNGDTVHKHKSVAVEIVETDGSVQVFQGAANQSIDVVTQSEANTTDACSNDADATLTLEQKKDTENDVGKIQKNAVEVTEETGAPMEVEQTSIIISGNDVSKNPNQLETSSKDSTSAVQDVGKVQKNAVEVTEETGAPMEVEQTSIIISDTTKDIQNPAKQVDKSGKTGSVSVTSVKRRRTAEALSAATLMDSTLESKGSPSKGSPDTSHTKTLGTRTTDTKSQQYRYSDSSGGSYDFISNKEEEEDAMISTNEETGITEDRENIHIAKKQRLDNLSDNQRTHLPFGTRKDTIGKSRTDASMLPQNKLPVEKDIALQEPKKGIDRVVGDNFDDSPDKSDSSFQERPFLI